MATSRLAQMPELLLVTDHISLPLLFLFAGLGGLLMFWMYILVRYAPVVVRIFEEKPVFYPLQAKPIPGGEDVRFATSDGLKLVGTYFRTPNRRRLGVIVFCHEFLGNRWSALPYAGDLLQEGFDLFCFDFRNHGESEVEPGYEPLQWVCGREVRDLQAVLAYLRSRPDHDPSGFALYGISRGGGTALCVAAETADVWGVVTDGAFPTRGTMLAYILRWAEIYVPRAWVRGLIPIWMFAIVGWVARMGSQWRLRRVFPDVEQATRSLSPRPLLMIHGARDAYIGPSIARALFDQAREPKEFWLVPDAKHNRCRELRPLEYQERLHQFFRRYAPRIPALLDREPPPPPSEPVLVSATALAGSAHKRISTRMAD